MGLDLAIHWSHPGSHSFFNIFFLLQCWGLKCRTFSTLGKHSTIKLRPQTQADILVLSYALVLVEVDYIIRSLLSPHYIHRDVCIVMCVVLGHIRWGKSSSIWGCVAAHFLGLVIQWGAPCQARMKTSFVPLFLWLWTNQSQPVTTSNQIMLTNLNSVSDAQFQQSNRKCVAWSSWYPS